MKNCGKRLFFFLLKIILKLETTNEISKFHLKDYNNFFHLVKKIHFTIFQIIFPLNSS